MKIVEFIKSNLLDKKEMFAKCYYLDVRSYEENTTNPVEQQNSANKTGHIKTKPNMSLKASAVKLTLKSRSSINEKNISHCSLIDNSSLWSKSKTASEIVPNIEGIITQG